MSPLPEDWIREEPRARGIKPCSPSGRSRKAPFGYDKAPYRQRHKAARTCSPNSRIGGASPLAATEALVGVDGVDVGGFRTGHLSEATMMVAMIEAARRAIVLADSRKFGLTPSPRPPRSSMSLRWPPTRHGRPNTQAALEAAGSLTIVAPDNKTGQADPSINLSLP